MLSAVLKSDIAVEISVNIIRAFVNMRKFISNNALIFQRLETLENKQSKNDEKFNKLFDAIEDKTIKPKQRIFYDRQVFDAYTFVADLIMVLIYLKYLFSMDKTISHMSCLFLQIILNLG